MWRHADRILATGADELARTDAISALKRAVAHRVRSLVDLYSLDLVPVSEKPKRKQELLAYLGLLRQEMLRRLIEIRNAVEHEDAPPPELLTCRELAEFTWYFLRSTERYVRQVVRSFTLGPPGEDPGHPIGLGLELRTDDGWPMRVHGCLRAMQVSETQQAGWIVVAADKVKRRCSLPNANPSHGHPASRPDDIYLEGCFAGPEEHLRGLVTLYFEVL
jgi:hypothetical protein